MRRPVPPASLAREVISAALAAILVTLVLLCVARDATGAEVLTARDVPVASVGGGNILLDGHPFFMIGSWWQCAADVDRNLALGINVFVASLCDERALAESLGDRAWMIGSIDGDEELPSSIGYLQPDEPDVHGIPGSRLVPPVGKGKLTLLNVSMNFWDGAHTAGIDYDAMFKKGDVLSTDVYPMKLNCNRAPWVTLETPYDVQLQLAALGKPSGQWLEVNGIDNFCPGTLTPAMVQAEAWLAVEGGASWIGWFFPEATGNGRYDSFSVTPAIAEAVKSVNQQLTSLALVLLDGRLSITTPWGNGLPTGPGSNPIKVGGRSHNGRYYLFATNSTDAVVRWTRTFPELLEKAPVRLESESGTLTAGKGGVVVDSFKPFETRIYSWAPMGPALTRSQARTVTIVLGNERPLLATTMLVPGKVKFVVMNQGKTAHALAVTGVGLSKRTSAIKPGKSAILTVTLRRDTYAFWDPITGTIGRAVHRRVEPANLP